MYTSFYIKEERLNELNQFIKKELPSARFKHNPLKDGDKWFIALTMDVEDGNKLSVLESKWYDEDNHIEHTKDSIWDKLLNFFR